MRELGGGDRAKAIQVMIEETVADMYRVDDENRFLEVTYQGGDKEILYFKDFASGAMIENIVRRAKKLAVKREIAGDGRGLRGDDLIESIRQEYRENEDLPNTTNPDDWARISGKKGERIIFIRTLINREETDRRGWALDRSTSAPASTSRTDGHRQGPRHRDRVRDRRADRTCDPIIASSMIVNAYAQQGRTRINWDFEGETPDLDARGLPGLTAFAPIVETHLANTVLTNGARLYVDHAHPEYSVARVPHASRGDALRRGGRGGAAPGAAPWPTSASTPARRSRSTRTTPTARATPTAPTRTTCSLATWTSSTSCAPWCPHFVSRQIVVGAGKVGAETETAWSHATPPSRSASAPSSSRRWSGSRRR